MLRCKPDQLATIVVPPTRENLAMGFIQNNGHVVRCKWLLVESVWVVEPPQWNRPPNPELLNLPAGALLCWKGVPDAWLLPWRDIPPQELVDKPVEVSA